MTGDETRTVTVQHPHASRRGTDLKGTTMTSSMTRKAATLVLAGALVLGAVACSSDDDTANTADSTTDASTPAGDGGVTVVEEGLDDATADALAQAAATAFAETSAPGAVMAIRTEDGDWVATAGYQDWDETVPMTADVNQRIGSVTKTFTVTALLQLAEEGDLSLDDPIEQYVPGMPNGDATLGELAGMRSGIPSYTFDEEFQDILFSDPNRVWEPQQLVDLVKGEEPMFEPGTMMFYSNTNLVLLGMAIEQVADAPIQDVLQDQVLEPLGLDDTFMPTDGAYPEPHPQGYTMQGVDGDEPADATDWNPSWGWTAGAMISDLDDMLVWGEALATGEGILSPETQAERLDSFDFDIPVYTGPGTSAPQSPARAYGLGL
ncbi:hypothetical protein B7486_57905, partial [cyanobacterium TDX16]